MQEYIERKHLVVGLQGRSDGKGNTKEWDQTIVNRHQDCYRRVARGGNARNKGRGEGGGMWGRVLGLAQRTTASLLNINTKTTSKKMKKEKIGASNQRPGGKHLMTQSEVNEEGKGEVKTEGKGS